MHPLETDSTGNLAPAELARFGGTYTFREKLKLVCRLFLRGWCVSFQGKQSPKNSDMR